jgi:hypothetical protein
VLRIAAPDAPSRGKNRVPQNAIRRFSSKTEPARSSLPGAGRRDDGTINKDQRRALGATARELANYGVAAMVFGQFVGEGAVSWWRFVVGVALWFALVAFALILEGE